MNRKSLLWHIVQPFLAVIELSLVLITGYTSRSLRDFVYDQTARDLEDRARLLQTEIEPRLAEARGWRIRAGISVAPDPRAKKGTQFVEQAWKALEVARQEADEGASSALAGPQV